MNKYLPLLFLVLMVLTQCSQKKENSQQIEMIEQNSHLKLLVGTYTGTGSEGVYMATFDPESGKLSEKKLVAKTSNPSYLAVSHNTAYVFAVNEEDSGKVSSFHWHDGNDSLELVDQKPAYGAYPCYISVNGLGDKIALANYGTGNVALYDVKNGEIGNAPVKYQHEGKGPNAGRQEGPHAHFAEFDPEGKFVYAIDLGIDAVMAYPVGKGGDGHVALKLQGGDGPRHLVFHPEKEWVFIVNELSNTVVSAKMDLENGQMEIIDRAPTLPEGFAGKSQCADIHISNDGKFLYASNRGHHSIAIFSVGEDGKLEMLGTESTKGDWPRNFTFSPDGNYLLVANQNSDNIVVFSVNKETGMLTPTGNEIEIYKPVCLKFL